MEKKTLDRIVNNIKEMEDMTSRLAKGELILNKNYQIANTARQAVPYYQELMKEYFELQKKHPVAHFRESIIDVTTRLLIHPIEYFKKMGYLSRKLREIKKNIKE